MRTVEKSHAIHEYRKLVIIDMLNRLDVVNVMRSGYINGAINERGYWLVRFRE